VKWFNAAKGYGFIQRSGGEDVFVHLPAIETSGYRTLEEGSEVEFEVKRGPKGLQAILFGFLSAVAGGLYFVPRPQRGRRIPTAVRRAVIARDLKGQPFDPKIHHIDHIVPFSKGGDHSMENLRVLSRSRNLERGARRPKFKDLL
jgi:cold shock protein